jgi:hypothetical protein
VTNRAPHIYEFEFPVPTLALPICNTAHRVKFFR